jgi:hypothetical protein
MTRLLPHLLKKVKYFIGDMVGWLNILANGYTRHPFIQSVGKKHVTWWVIHPKYGEEACDLVGHSSKSVRVKHVTWRPFIQSVEEKHVT